MTRLPEPATLILRLTEPWDVVSSSGQAQHEGAVVAQASGPRAGTRRFLVQLGTELRREGLATSKVVLEISDEQAGELMAGGTIEAQFLGVLDDGIQTDRLLGEDWWRGGIAGTAEIKVK